MIKIRNISKSFGKLKALDAVNLDLETGHAVALIGPNGSGKTTLIKCLLGMVLPEDGDIQLDGTSIIRQWQYRARIGYMPQTGSYPDNMTIGQVFDMMCDLRRVSLGQCDRHLIDAFGLEGMMNKRMRNLSGGTTQKVSASLAFLFNPDILVLDEPTAGLDPVSSELLKEKIRQERSKGKLILITSHILSDLDDLVSEVIYLQDGRLLFHKSIAQLRSDTREEKLSRAIAVVMQNSMKEYV